MAESVIKNLYIILLINFSVIGCTSTPQTTLEPPCTRTYEPYNNNKGKSFIIRNDDRNSWYRYNKAMWANHNRFVPKDIVENKKATIMCHELVPGPGGINQHVVALKVEGVLETIYVNSSNITGALAREESSAKIQEV